MNTPAGPQGEVTTRQMPSIATLGSATIPSAPALVAPSGDGCPSCGSPMASDQRYCIECGERRGDSRFTTLEEAAAPQPAATAAAPAANAPQPASSRGRSQGLALIATIGLLLLAMGVGVLIGNNGDSKAGVAQQPIVIGAAGPTAAAPAPTDATAASSTKSSEGGGDASSDASTANADAVAKKNGVKLAPKDAKLGAKCEGDAVGCDGGKFTGDFFGGGN